MARRDLGRAAIAPLALLPTLSVEDSDDASRDPAESQACGRGAAVLRPSRQHLTLVLRLGRVLGRALLVDPGARDEDDGEDADDDEARRVFLMRQRVVADDGLDARRRELADKRGDDIVAHRHRGERAERVEQDGGEVRHHARDEHDGEAALAAVLVGSKVSGAC